MLPNWFTAFLVMLVEAWSARRDPGSRNLLVQGDNRRIAEGQRSARANGNL